MTAKTIVFIALAILIVVFTIQNTEVINIKFYPWERSIPAALILLGTLFIGIILGWLLTLTTGYSRRKRKVKAEAEEKKPLL
jgi:uncharacterized integral membrane protein